jgi:hypothetical protein
MHLEPLEMFVAGFAQIHWSPRHPSFRVLSHLTIQSNCGRDILRVRSVRIRPFQRENRQQIVAIDWLRSSVVLPCHPWGTSKRVPTDGTAIPRIETTFERLLCCAKSLAKVALRIVVLTAALGTMRSTVAPAAMQPPARVEITCVDERAIGYATFQSHNQKVVANRHGIFVTHLRTRNESYASQTWRLSRSRDRGQTFETVYEDTHATNPPVLETDRDGNVYLVRVDFDQGDGYLYRFPAETDFQQPRITRIPGAAAGKYAMILDAEREQLYFFSHNNTFHRIRLDGVVEQRVNLLRAGTNAVLQYPLLSLDDRGRLHAAWTTQRHGEYLYWDIHHMVSIDGAESWQNLDGGRLNVPVVADDTGGAMRVTQDDEFTGHTWLSSCLARNGKLHLLYLAQTKPSRQHYIRYDIASAKRDIHITPQFRGASIELRGLDGYFVANRNQLSTIYCVGHDQGRLACLVSRDDGATWHDYARSPQRFSLYSVGGFRCTTHDDCIVGTFTDQHGSNLTTDRNSKVYFFRIRHHTER